jgi:hypothetical protein
MARNLMVTLQSNGGAAFGVRVRPNRAAEGYDGRCPAA